MGSAWKLPWQGWIKSDVMAKHRLIRNILLLIPGIVAYESLKQAGVPMDVPDCGNPPENW